MSETTPEKPHVIAPWLKGKEREWLWHIAVRPRSRIFDLTGV